MGEFEDILGDMGANQWVKNRFARKLRDFRKAGSVNVDKFLAEFNDEILADFKMVVNEAITEVIERADQLLNPPQGKQ